MPNVSDQKQFMSSISKGQRERNGSFSPGTATEEMGLWNGYGREVPSGHVGAEPRSPFAVPAAGKGAGHGNVLNKGSFSLLQAPPAPSVLTLLRSCVLGGGGESSFNRFTSVWGTSVSERSSSGGWRGG